MTDSLNARLRYGSAKHNKILSALRSRKKKAKDKVEERTSDFEEFEELYDAYLPETEDDKLRKARFQKDGDPDYYTVVVPYSYAALLTAHTYWTSVFLSRTPVLQYTGRHGEPQMKVQAVEAIMDYQVMVGEMLGPLYHWMHDAPKYGYGVIYDYWDKEVIQTSRIVEESVEFMGVPIPGKSKRIKQTDRTVGYIGNKIMNVHPSHFWPDWRVAMTDIQKGEFIARYVELSWNALLKGKHKQQYFNLDVVEKMASSEDGASSWEGGVTTELPEDETDVGFDIADIAMQKGFEIIIELVPKEWELGSSNYPEKWVFTVIGDKVIIEARPYGRAHNRFPYSVLPMDFDAYKLFSTSMMDRLRPLNDMMTWLINQHFYNVRSSLGNNFVFDPSRVVVKDLTRRGTSKLIRLKEAAYGTDISKVIQQLPVHDVTKGHLGEASNISELFNKVFGINDNLMGQIHQGGRKTATEIRTSSTFGINRLKTVAEYWSAIGFMPFSQRILQNTQELYDEEQQFKVAGQLAGDAQFINVDPATIAGLYDFVPVDGTMPIDRYAQANLWKEIITGVSKIPQIGQRYDLGGIFSWMAQLAGLKNIKQFEVQMMPDQMMQQQAQQGNIVPMSQAVPNQNEPGQIPGMGATG